MTAYGLVLESNLRQVVTLSVGQITIDNTMITYHGTQRVAKDNEGRPVYGGSDLVCVRGGWKALAELPMTAETRLGIAQARLYEAAMSAYPGFIASRRNYDVGQGIDAQGQWRSGVLESSWRSGGVSTAELAALTAFAQDPTLQVVEASAVKQYGGVQEPPPTATVHFLRRRPSGRSDPAVYDRYAKIAGGVSTVMSIERWALRFRAARKRWFARDRGRHCSSDCAKKSGRFSAA